MLSSQAFTEKLGPADRPHQATDTGNKGQYVYRVLRAYESPWNMRIPPNADISHAEMRVMLVTAIAHGNDEHETSLFLHTTTSLTKAIRLLQERKLLYSNWLTRWKKDCVEQRVDFDNKPEKYKWLSEDDNDNEYVRQAVKTSRRYVEKDSEVVYMRHPGDRNIEWWDEVQKQWRQFSEIPSAFQATARSQKLNRTPSEERRENVFGLLNPEKEALHS